MSQESQKDYQTQKVEFRTQFSHFFLNDALGEALQLILHLPTKGSKTPIAAVYENSAYGTLEKAAVIFGTKFPLIFFKTCTSQCITGSASA